MSKTAAGVWIGTPPFVHIDDDVSPWELGTAVADALFASKSEVPHPTDWKGLLAPLLQVAGVKSWKTFMQGAQCVGIDNEDGRIRVISCRNRGPKKGFEEMLDTVVELPSTASMEVLGKAIEEAITRSASAATA